MNIKLSVKPLHFLNYKKLKPRYQKDAEFFAETLSAAKLANNCIYFGNFALKATKGVKDSIQYNKTDGTDLLNNQHEYTIQLMSGELQLSLQLYENVNSHYRLFAYTKFGDIRGMVFSVNLTTEKESDNIIFLTQKLKFVEQYDGNKKLAQAHRRQKQIIMAEIIKKLGLEVTDNNDLILGIFDPISKKFINTSPDKFLNDFIAVSLIKGHFQGNKGYELDILPSYRLTENNSYCNTRDDNIDKKLPRKILNQKTKRNIPLSLRYKVLIRDGGKCVLCGRSANDGVILHVDHITPYSHGGLTELSNLRTLCQECNIGKSNKFIE